MTHQGTPITLIFLFRFRFLLGRPIPISILYYSPIKHIGMLADRPNLLFRSRVQSWLPKSYQFWGVARGELFSAAAEGAR